MTYVCNLLGRVDQTGELYARAHPLLKANTDSHFGHDPMQQSRTEASSTEHRHIQLVANLATHIIMSDGLVGSNQFMLLKSTVESIGSSAARFGPLYPLRFEDSRGIYSKSGGVYLLRFS